MREPTHTGCHARHGGFRFRSMESLSKRQTGNGCDGCDTRQPRVSARDYESVALRHVVAAQRVAEAWSYLGHIRVELVAT